MTGFRKKYRVLHVHYVRSESMVMLCLEPTDRLPRTSVPIVIPGGTEEERIAGHMAQATVKAMQRMIPERYLQERNVEIEISLEDYERMGRPGILDEVTLTLEKEKEPTE